jgi:toxin FitB
MSYLLDTDIVSEWVKPRPDSGVVNWFETVDEDRVFISVVTLAELRYGVERMPSGARRRRLEEWLRDDLPLRFEGRVLPVDGPVADAWGKVVARSESSGRRMSAIDGFIAATAEVCGLALVTRNTADFQFSLNRVVNPWSRA